MFRHISMREQMRESMAETKKLRADVGEKPYVEEIGEEVDNRPSLFEVIEKIEDMNADYFIDVDFRLTLIELEG